MSGTNYFVDSLADLGNSNQRRTIIANEYANVAEKLLNRTVFTERHQNEINLSLFDNLHRNCIEKRLYYRRNRFGPSRDCADNKTTITRGVQRFVPPMTKLHRQLKREKSSLHWTIV